MTELQSLLENICLVQRDNIVCKQKMLREAMDDYVQKHLTADRTNLCLLIRQVDDEWQTFCTTHPDLSPQLLRLHIRVLLTLSVRKGKLHPASATAFLRQLGW